MSMIIVEKEKKGPPTSPVGKQIRPWECQDDILALIIEMEVPQGFRWFTFWDSCDLGK
jgi:hypothetical protein